MPCTVKSCPKWTSSGKQVCKKGLKDCKLRASDKKKKEALIRTKWRKNNPKKMATYNENAKKARKTITEEERKLLNENRRLKLYLKLKNEMGLA